MDEFKQDAENYINLMKEMENIKDNQYSLAFNIHIRAMVQYERWSTILFELRKCEAETKIKQVALKNRIEDVMKSLNNIYTSARMLWARGEERMKKES